MTPLRPSSSIVPSRAPARATRGATADVSGGGGERVERALAAGSFGGRGMKLVLVGILAAVGGAALGLMIVLFSGPRGAGVTVGDDGALRKELARSRDEVRELLDRLARLEQGMVELRR